jgi:hypothetical protein
MIKRESWLGQPMEQLREKHKKQIAEFDSLVEIIDAHNAGESTRSIAGRFGLTPKTVRTYIAGTRLPRNVSLVRAKHYEKRAKPVFVKKGKEADFAFVLGAMMGNASRIRIQGQQKLARVQLGVKDKAFAQAFQQKLAVSTGLQEKLLQKQGLFFVDLGSVKLVQLFNRLTNYGTIVPSAFLDSAEARRQFVKAIFDSRGTITRGGPAKTRLLIVNPINQELKKFVLIVLTENGFHPKQRYDGKISLPLAEHERFFSVIGFSRQTKL